MGKREDYEAILVGFPLKLKANKSRGRYMCASQDLNVGQLLLTECPSQAVIFKDLAPQFCQHCFMSINSKKSQQQDMLNVRNRSTEDLVSCTNCRKQSFWCSQECKTADEIHTFCCNYLIELPGIAGMASVDYNLLRLMVHVLTRQHLEKTNDLKGTPIKFLMDLLSHQKSATEKFTNAMLIACHDLVDLFKDGPLHTLSIDDLFKLACRINSNSHAMNDPSRHLNQPIGVGMFPLVAMLNHSCSPNAVYVTSSDGSMKVIAVHPIQKGEEICVSYVDLFSPKWMRQGELLATKHFWCECTRCVDVHDDLLMDALLCPICKIGAILPSGEVHRCNKCDHLMTKDDIDTILDSIDIQSGMDLYKAGLLDSALAVLQTQLSKVEDNLYSHHYKKLEVYVTLVTLCSKLSNFIQAEYYCKKAIEQMIRISEDAKLGRYIPELANLYEKQVELLEILVEGIESGLIQSENLNSYKDEIPKSTAKFTDIRNICFNY